MRSEIVLVITLLFSAGCACAAIDSADTSSTVVRASQAGAALDSDLMKGGGTDDTAVLQRVLDRAKKGRGVHLIIDGPALVSGIDIFSNSTIECTGGGGLYLKDRSARAIVRNGHRSKDGVTDRRISIRNCFLNGNSDGQPIVGPPLSAFRAAQEPDGTFMSGLQFLGVHGLFVDNVTLWNIRSFGIGVANAKFVQIRDVIVDIGAPPFPEDEGLAAARVWVKRYAGNRDGLNFAGPVQYVTIVGLLLRTWDDGLSFHTDIAAAKENALGPYLGTGPITDVTVNNVVLMGASHGIRLESASERMDRIVISNVSGTARERMAVISPMFFRQNGNFGAIAFSDVTVDLVHSYPRSELYAPLLEDISPAAIAATKQWHSSPTFDVGEEVDLPLFSLNGRIEILQLRNVSTKGPAGRPIIRVGKNASIESLNVDLSIYDPQSLAIPMKLMGQVKRLAFSLDWTGKVAIQEQGGKIQQLRWERAEYQTESRRE